MTTTHQWRRDEATDLIGQGYSVEDVAGRCGLTVRQVRALRPSQPSLREAVQKALDTATAPPKLSAKKKPAKKAPAPKARKKKVAKKAPARKRASKRPVLEVVKTA